MQATDANTTIALGSGPSRVKRPYEKPLVSELGDVRELTLGPGVGSQIDKSGTKRPNTGG